MKLTEHRVGDIMTLVRRPVDVRPDETYQEIGLRSFGNGVFHKEPVSGEELGSKRVFYINPGDLLFSNVFAWEGAVAIASEREAGKIGSHRFMTYEVDLEKADPRYLRYYFYGGPGLEVLRAASPGSAGRNRTLGVKTLERQTIGLPERDEQRRIADKLDALVSRIDRVELLRSRMSKMQQDIRESIISSALATSRSMAHIGDLLALTRTQVSIDESRQYRWIGMRSFGNGLIHYGPAPGSNLSKLKYYTFPIGAITFNNIMAWEGAIGVTTDAERDYIASQRFLFYMPTSSRVNVSYLRHYFLTRDGLALISACSPGAMARNRTLGIQKFEQQRIPIPDLGLQDEAAYVIDKLNAKLKATHAEPQLPAARLALLSAAFAGRL